MFIIGGKDYRVPAIFHPRLSDWSEMSLAQIPSKPVVGARVKTLQKGILWGLYGILIKGLLGFL